MTNGLHQGIYVVSSSGKLIDRIVGGWPEYDPKITLDGLKKGLQAYRNMPKEDRVKSSAIPPEEQVRFGWMDFKKPAGTLDLRITNRAYSYPGMTTFDERHPTYLGIDRIWFKPSELASLFPAKIEVGAKKSVSGPLLDRWILTSQMMKGSAAWDESMFTNANMTSTVKAVRENEFDLLLSAQYDIRANTQWNKGHYNGELLANATYNRQSKTFTKFECVLFGTHTAGTRLSNVHSGDLSAKIAAFATINPHSDPDDDMPPSEWMWRYTLRWCQSP